MRNKSNLLRLNQKIFFPSTNDMAATLNSAITGFAFSKWPSLKFLRIADTFFSDNYPITNGSVILKSHHFIFSFIWFPSSHSPCNFLLLYAIFPKFTIILFLQISASTPNGCVIYFTMRRDPAHSPSSLLFLPRREEPWWSLPWKALMVFTMRSSTTPEVILWTRH